MARRRFIPRSAQAIVSRLAQPIEQAKDASDLAARAARWSQRQAGAAVSGASGGLTAANRALEDFQEKAGAAARGAVGPVLGGASRALDVLQVPQRGVQTAFLAPTLHLAYGAGRLTEGSDTWSEDTDWFDWKGNRAAYLRARKNAPLSRALVGTAEIASDPLLYTPAKIEALRAVPVVGKAAFLAEGVGGVTAAQRAARVGTLAAGAGIGRTVGEDVGGPVGGMVGGLVGGGAALGGSSALSQTLRARGRGDLADVIDIPKASVVEETKPRPKPQSVEPTPTKRYYHGTGSAFERPEPLKFDEEGLYGPGYYVTNDPRVAGSYSTANVGQPQAFKRRTERIVQLERELAKPDLPAPERQRLSSDLAFERDMLGDALDNGRVNAAPNVRPVQLAPDFRIFDVEPSLTLEQTRSGTALGRLIDALGGDEPAGIRAEIARIEGSGPLTGGQFYRYLEGRFGRRGANESLAAAGFDGIRYAGGRAMPIRDEAGNPITHDALVIFPESLGKIRNALSGTEGGFADPAVALRTGAGAAVGGAVGYLSGDTEEERRRRALYGAAAGAGVSGVGPVVVARSADRIAEAGGPRAFIQSLARNEAGEGPGLPFGRHTPGEPDLIPGLGPVQGRLEGMEPSTFRGPGQPPDIPLPRPVDAGDVQRRVQAGAVPAPRESVLPKVCKAALAAPSHLLSAIREAALGGDFGQVMRYYVIGTLQSMGIGPGTALKSQRAFGKAIQAAVSWETADAYFASPRFQEAVLHMRAARNATQQVLEGESLMRRIADSDSPWALLAKPAAVPLAGMERMTFERFLPIYAAETFWDVYEGLRGQRGYRNMDAAALKDDIGERVSLLLVGIDTRGWPAMLRNAGKLSLISSAWTGGLLKNATHLAARGPEGDMARRFWAAATLSALTASVGLSAAFSDKTVGELLDPDQGVWNPTSPNFLRVHLGDRSIAPFQMVFPVARTLLRPVFKGAEAGIAEYQTERDKNIAIRDALGIGLWEGLKETGRSGEQFFTNRMSMPLRLLDEIIITERDYWGQEIAPSENPIIHRGQQALHAGKAFVPVFAQSLVAEGRPMPPGAGPNLTDRAVTTVSSWAGFEVRPPVRYPSEVDDAARTAARELGAKPVDDPLKAYRQAAAKLDADQRAALDRRYPQLVAFQRKETEIRAKAATLPKGRQARAAYQAQMDRLDTWRDQRLIALEQAGVGGREYRRQREQIMEEYRIRLEGAAAFLSQSPDPDVARAWVDQLYGERRDADAPVEKALAGLYRIKPEGDSPTDRDRYFAERKAYLNSLGPEMRQRLFQREQDRAPTDRERQYLQDKAVIDDYYDLPVYRGMSPDDSAAVVDALARASQAVSAGYAPDRRAALLRDRETSARIRVLARRVAASESTYRNSERRRYRLKHARVFTSYFTDLKPDEFAGARTG